MGRYEVQLRDSWKIAVLGTGESGVISRRWDGGRGAGKESFGQAKRGSGFAVCRSAMVALAVIDLGH